jgi:hypothetical protein
MVVKVRIVCFRSAKRTDVYVARLHARSRWQMWTDILVCRGSALPELLGACVVPLLDFLVGDEGEGAGGYVEGKGLACVGVLDIEGADGGLDEGDVLIWAEEYLDGLPSHEAFLCESGDGGRCEIVDGRLQRVLAAY